MTEETTQFGWDNWEPVVMVEQEMPDFSIPIKGRYIAEIESLEYKELERKDGSGNFELINMKMKICEDIDGDKSFNRKIDKAYFMGTSEWNDDPLAGYKMLLNNLKSNDLYEDWMKTDAIKNAVDKMNTELAGKQVFITAFPKKDKQQVRVVQRKDAVKVDTSTVSKFAV